METVHSIWRKDSQDIDTGQWEQVISQTETKEEIGVLAQSCLEAKGKAVLGEGPAKQKRPGTMGLCWGEEKATLPEFMLFYC